MVKDLGIIGGRLGTIKKLPLRQYFFLHTSVKLFCNFSFIVDRYCAKYHIYKGCGTLHTLQSSATADAYNLVNTG